MAIFLPPKHEKNKNLKSALVQHEEDVFTANVLRSVLLILLMTRQLIVLWAGRLAFKSCLRQLVEFFSYLLMIETYTSAVICQDVREALWVEPLIVV